MVSLVYAVAAAGTIATALMTLAVLYFVWQAMDDDVHAPTPDTGTEPVQDEPEKPV